MFLLHKRRIIIKNLIHRYFSANEKLHKQDPGEESRTPEEMQFKLMEVIKTLQSLQNEVKQFRHQTPAVSYDLLSRWAECLMLLLILGIYWS